jgi:hypothetical protein
MFVVRVGLSGYEWPNKLLHIIDWVDCIFWVSGWKRAEKIVSKHRELTDKYIYSFEETMACARPDPVVYPLVFRSSVTRLLCEMIYFTSCCAGYSFLDCIEWYNIKHIGSDLDFWSKLLS